MNRELLQRALDALENVCLDSDRASKEDTLLHTSAIAELRAALAVGDSASPGEPAIPPGFPEENAKLYVGAGKFAICDWEDWPMLRGYWWRMTAPRSGCTPYAQTWDSHDSGTRKHITMHSLIMSPPAGFVVDHINGDGLDNRRANLRIASMSQNMANSRVRNCSSKYKGVTWDKDGSCWRAYIKFQGRRMDLGRYGCELEAANAYDTAARQFFGEFALTNSLADAAAPKVTP